MTVLPAVGLYNNDSAAVVRASANYMLLTSSVYCMTLYHQSTSSFRDFSPLITAVRIQQLLTRHEMRYMRASSDGTAVFN